MNLPKEKKKEIVDRTVSNFNHKINKKELKMGIEVEKEHDNKVGESTNILKGNKEKLAKIAVVHLKEVPKYYTHLKKMEDKYKK